MEKALNPNTDLETMLTGTYPKGEETYPKGKAGQYCVLYAKRTDEGVNVTAEMQDGKVVMNRTVQPCP